MNKYIFVALFILFHYSVYAQSVIKGHVIDNQENPVVFANVYINATTNGTITDENGDFLITVSDFPCLLVVSHLNIETKHITIKDGETTYYDIKVSNKIRELQEIQIHAKNNRNRNLKLFQLNFLGENYRSDKIIIENPDAIRFRKEFVPENIKPEETGYSDQNMNSNQDSVKLIAYSEEPLKISVPKLGYLIYVDLVDFYYNYNNGESYFAGYYFFEETNNSEKIQSNRDKAYFNSSQHFCQSLFKNQLKSNGFRVLKISIDSNNSSSIEDYDFEKNISFEGDNIMHINGLKGETFKILYNSKLNGYPKNLNKNKTYFPVESSVYFASDNCIITKNGIVPNNYIKFSNAIGAKKVGAMVPDNYIPCGFKENKEKNSD